MLMKKAYHILIQPPKNADLDLTTDQIQILDHERVVSRFNLIQANSPSGTIKFFFIALNLTMDLILIQPLKRSWVDYRPDHGCQPYRSRPRTNCRQDPDCGPSQTPFCSLECQILIFLKCRRNPDPWLVKSWSSASTDPILILHRPDQIIEGV